MGSVAHHDTFAKLTGVMVSENEGVGLWHGLLP